MNSKKILIVSTYPKKRAQHGGQKRLQAIFKAYQQNFSQVKSCAVFYKGFYSTYEADDIPLGKRGEQAIMSSPLTDDLACGGSIYDDPEVKTRFIALLKAFSPDVIHLEQPATYKGVKKVLKKMDIRPIIIFGSQNIESPMKRQILLNAGVTTKEAEQAAKELADLEQQLSKDCDLLAACTLDDLKVHQSWGAKNVVLAPNGIDQSVTDDAALAYWQTTLRRESINRTALYIASGHPPNWTGFLDTVGKGLGFIPYDSRLIVAGSVCDYFEREIRSDSQHIEDVTFWLRAHSAGRISEHSLGALLQLTDVIILPITEGGGSNLKSAEAILADKKVVTTSHGLRSFEWFKEFPNVWVADTAKDFRMAITDAFKTDYVARTTEQKLKAEQVQWTHCLNDLVQKVAQL